MTPHLPSISVVVVAICLGAVGLAMATPADRGPKEPAPSGPRPAMGQEADRATTDPGPFEAHVYRDAKGRVLPYRLLKPAALDERGDTTKVPLAIFLHGVGERGTDNRAQLRHGRACMLAVRDHGALVVVPQCPPTDRWAVFASREDHSLSPEPTEAMRLLVGLIDRIEKDYPVDRDRVYVGGVSMGGFGTWEMIARWPDRFAAAVPICGGGDESRAKAMARVPIWAFHGDADPVVPVARSRDMIRAIREAGGRPKYTEYKGVGHDSWNRALAEPELIKWLFEQRREPGTADERR